MFVDLKKKNLQLYYTPDHLDLCVQVSYDNVVSMETHGVKPDNIFDSLDEWLPKGQSSVIVGGVTRWCGVCRILQESGQVQ